MLKSRKIKVIIGLNIVIILFIFFQFQTNNQVSNTAYSKVRINYKEQFKNQYYTYLGDSLLVNHSNYLKDYISKYKLDTCEIQYISSFALKSEFKGVLKIGDINNDNSDDSVFVLNSFLMCDPGDTYCFTSSSLPPLHTESECCHPSCLFLCPDINEDGIHEIGIYFSSCASRFKSLKIFTLYDNKWNAIGVSDFDIQTKDPSQVPFTCLVRKVSKNIFSICNFLDERTFWDTINLNKIYSNEIQEHDFFCDTLEQTQYGSNLCSMNKANYSDSILNHLFNKYLTLAPSSDIKTKWAKQQKAEIDSIIKLCGFQPYCIQEVNEYIFNMNLQKIKELEILCSKHLTHKTKIH
jgi:hypothetical protein